MHEGWAARNHGTLKDPKEEEHGKAERASQGKVLGGWYIQAHSVPGQKATCPHCRTHVSCLRPWQTTQLFKIFQGPELFLCVNSHAHSILHTGPNPEKQKH